THWLHMCNRPRRFRIGGESGPECDASPLAPQGLPLQREGPLGAGLQRRQRNLPAIVAGPCRPRSVGPPQRPLAIRWRALRLATDMWEASLMHLPGSRRSFKGARGTAVLIAAGALLLCHVTAAEAAG